MDESSQVAVRLLETLARCNVKLESLWRMVREKSAVSTSEQRLEVRQYDGVSTIEGYVDVELKSGKAICWWVEVTWSREAWVISASIRIVDAQGQYDLLAFPEVETKTFNGVAAGLEAAVSELERSALRVDLDQDPPAVVSAGT